MISTYYALITVHILLFTTYIHLFVSTYAACYLLTVAGLGVVNHVAMGDISMADHDELSSLILDSDMCWESY